MHAIIFHSSATAAATFYLRGLAQHFHVQTMVQLPILGFLAQT